MTTDEKARCYDLINKSKEKQHEPDPFISQNVWLKRLGGVYLLIGLGFIDYGPNVEKVMNVIIVLILITYAVKQVKGFIKSIWKS